MTQIPPDDILETLCKLRIRESDKPTALELHKKCDYHRLKTVVKSSIEQYLRRTLKPDGNFETSAVNNPRMKQREERSLGDCWVGKKETIAVRSSCSTAVQGIL